MAVHRRLLTERAERAETAGELFAVASEQLRRLVAYDGAVWLATDPVTNLPTAPTRSENLAHVTSSAHCLRTWELELAVEDVNLFRDLARAASPVGGLRVATRDRPARSARYRELLRPLGIHDELRAVLRADGRAWASIGLFRNEGSEAFGAPEIELVAGLSGPLGAAVRDRAWRPAQLPPAADPCGPGVMLFAPDGELVSVNEHALAWLDEIMWLDELPADFEGEASFGVRLPLAVVGALARARAIAEQRDHQPARTRLRSSAGRWLVCHASCMRDPNGDLGNTVLVIEQAQASEIAPIIVEVYKLSAREQEITQLISRGVATAEIAQRLHLSVHTVRDYIQAIFEKVEVTSRGELVAKLFAEHYAPIHFDPANHDCVGE
jgi:DNA-binding CsgD family transcriptional regulator